MLQEQSFKRDLGLLDSTMIVIGSMIGSGIFIVSADISRTLGGGGWVLLVWALTGVFTLIAALSYGELAGMMPKAGGQYVYLREAYNPLSHFCMDGPYSLLFKQVQLRLLPLHLQNIPGFSFHSSVKIISLFHLDHFMFPVLKFWPSQVSGF